MDNKLLFILLGIIFLAIIFFSVKSKIDIKKRADKEAEEEKKEQARIRKQEKEQSTYHANLNKNAVSAKKSSILEKKELDTKKKPSSWTSTESYEQDIEKSAVVREVSTKIIQPEEGNTQEPKVKILLVDDSLVVRKYVGALLTKTGYEIILKTDGVEALEYLKTQSQPELIISDIEMPNMNGIELISQLRQMDNFMTIPILVISAHAESHLKLMETQSIQGFIKKPFKDEDLLMQIEYVLENSY